MSETPRTSWAAVLSFLLGLSSILLCLSVLTGVPAVWLGLASLRAINRSDGKLRGSPFAIGGLITGALGILLTILGVGAIIALKLRATSQAAECRNNLRLIGAALNKYADAHDSFPPAALGPRELLPEKRVSWIGGIVPVMGDTVRQSEAFAELGAVIDLKQPWDGKANEAARDYRVRYFLCPGHPEFGSRTRPALTTYVGLAGLGPDAARRKREDKDAGVFGYSRGIRRDEATAGVEYTLAVLETGQDIGPWLAGGPATVRGLAPDETAYLGPGRPFGGLHTGATQALSLDGSARALSDDMAPGVLRSMVTLKRTQD